jgi:phosphoribosylamine-glycine ligase
MMGRLDGLVMQVFVDPDAFLPNEVVDAVQTIAISIFGSAGCAARTPSSGRGTRIYCAATG